MLQLSHHNGSGCRTITERFKGPKTDWLRKVVGSLCLAACPLVGGDW